jgi:hypothetical protein
MDRMTAHSRSRIVTQRSVYDATNIGNKRQMSLRYNSTAIVTFNVAGKNNIFLGLCIK